MSEMSSITQTAESDFELQLGQVKRMQIKAIRMVRLECWKILLLKILLVRNITEVQWKQTAKFY